MNGCKVGEGTDRAQFLLLYASQTGQAKAIAEEFHDVTLAEGLSPELHCFSLTDKKFSIERASVAVIITSTTGDGEPPETALRLWKRLKRVTLPDDHLAHLSYSLLGLGDSNYNNFCNFGKSLDKRLLELGARQFYPSNWADDATGLEIVAEPWMDGVLTALKVLFGFPATSRESACCSHETIQSDIILTSISSPASEQINTDVVSNSIAITECQSNTQENVDISGIDCTTNLGSKIFPSKAEEKKEQASVAENIQGCDSILLLDVLASGDFLQTIGLITTHTSSKEAESDVDQLSDKNLVDITDTTRSVSQFQSSDMAELNVEADKVEVDDSVPDAFSIQSEQLATVSPTNKDVSLIHSCPPLSTGPLTLPLAPKRYLDVIIQPNVPPMADMEDVVQNNFPFSGARSSLSKTQITVARRLTRTDAVKTALEIELNITNCDWSYDPGDTIGVVCPNSDEDVDFVLARLGLAHFAHTRCSLELLSASDQTSVAGTRNRNTSLPEHIPLTSTPFYILRNCCEIRDVPRKVFLRALADVSMDASEKRRLQELCSKQGADHYTWFIREPSVTIVDILHAFPSCQPSLALLLEHCQRLMPRPYSIASSSLRIPGHLRFVFNIVCIPAGEGRHAERRGICTGWLDRLTNHMQHASVLDVSCSLVGDAQMTADDDLSSRMLDALKLTDGQSTSRILKSEIEVMIFLRRNLHFCLPPELSIPIVMIGPGTGVAPFIGFLQHRMELRSKVEASLQYGATWLFYGCRHRDRDYLYRDELAEFVACGVLTRLHVCFSRDEVSSDMTLTDNPGVSSNLIPPRHVQDNMIRHGAELANLIHNSNAVVYVCGDARGMAPQVLDTFKRLLIVHKDMDEIGAFAYMTKMRTERRYLEDVWT